MHLNLAFADPPTLMVNIILIKDNENSSIVVQWDIVDDSLTTTYIVTWTSESDHILHHTTRIEQSSYRITGLTLDTVYTITVTASNRCGQGPEYRTSVLLPAGMYHFITYNLGTYQPVASMRLVSRDCFICDICLSICLCVTLRPLITFIFINHIFTSIHIYVHT